MELAVLGERVADVVRDDDRQADLPGEARGLGDEPVVAGQEVVRQLEDEAGGRDRAAAGRGGAGHTARTRPARSPEDPRVALRDRPGPRPIAGQQAPGQLPVTAAGERDEPLGVLGEERLRDPRRPLRAGEVRPRDEAAEAPVPGVVPGEEDEMRAALPHPDAAVILLPRLAVAGQASSDRPGAGREPVPGHLERGVHRRPPTHPGAGRAARRDHEPVRVRDEGVDELHLHSDDRVEAGLLRGRGEPDDPVEALAIRDGETGEAELDRPGDEVEPASRPPRGRRSSCGRGARRRPRRTWATPASRGRRRRGRRGGGARS